MMSGAAPALLRLAVFALVLAAMLGAEAVWPARPRLQRRAHRWFTNLGLVVLGNAAVRVLMALPAPLAAAAAALWASAHRIGMLNVVAAPDWFRFVVALLALDLAVWAQHVWFHRSPLLWRLHLVHHADRDLDATSGLRFHPLEIVLSMVIKSAVVLVLGAPAAAVLAFEILLNACATFNHANISLPRGIEGVVRRFLVTRDLHRVHHSTLASEHNSNFGFCLSVWDWLFATMTAPPVGAFMPANIGLRQAERAHPERMAWVLAAPFQKQPAPGGGGGEA